MLEVHQAFESFTSATELLGAAGLDVGQCDAIAFMLGNTGDTNAITALAVYWSLDEAGTRWSAADPVIATAFAAQGSGVTAHGASFRTERPGTVARRMRIVATSTSGTTAYLDLYGRTTGRVS